MSLTLPDIVSFFIVEDDEGHARLMEKNLRRAHIAEDIRHFNTGQSVLDYLQGDGASNDNHPKILILLDLNLPEMDGYEVLKRLKSDLRTYTIPIIVWTTTDNEAEIQRCYALGCNFYMTKPIDYGDFAEAIRKIGEMLTITKIPQRK